MSVRQHLTRKYQSPSGGFTLLELVVVITIIVVLMGLFINRMMFYREQAEKTAMQQVEGAIQSALMLQYGEIMTRGNSADIATLVEVNPMNWLQKKPLNYAGEFYDPPPQTVKPGYWAFDLKSRDLVYVLRNADHFKPGKDGNNWIRFHVLALSEPSRLASLKDQPAELSGLLFEPLEPYVWF